MYAASPLAFACLVASLFCACALTQPNPPNVLTPEGEKVVVVPTLANLTDCRSAGMITARAASVFGKVDMTEDQTVDARNKAAKLGGNRVMRREATEPVAEPGTRSYEAFICPVG
jgi:hypothetical protein